MDGQDERQRHCLKQDSQDEWMDRMKSKNLLDRGLHHAAMTTLPLIALTFRKKIGANTQARP